MDQNVNRGAADGGGRKRRRMHSPGNPPAPTSAHVQDQLASARANREQEYKYNINDLERLDNQLSNVEEDKASLTQCIKSLQDHSRRQAFDHEAHAHALKRENIDLFTENQRLKNDVRMLRESGHEVDKAHDGTKVKNDLEDMNLNFEDLSTQLKAEKQTTINKSAEKQLLRDGNERLQKLANKISLAGLLATAYKTNAQLENANLKLKKPDAKPKDEM